LAAFSHLQLHLAAFGRLKLPLATLSCHGAFALAATVIVTFAFQLSLFGL
jgi:hypothetical protein